MALKPASVEAMAAIPQAPASHLPIEERKNRQNQKADGARFAPLRLKIPGATLPLPK
jgi:hypothetical protein